MAYLLDHPPKRSQYRNPRRERPSGCVVLHSAENTPDTVATDGGAEAVARFIQGRSDPGSYHLLADSDSRIQLVPWSYEAFQDGTGSNPHAVGLSVATTAAWWPLAPDAWRNGAVEQLAIGAASYAEWLYRLHGITIPARRISRAESERRLPGFISHAERDPARRSDPGAHFPWRQFLDRYAQLTAALGNAPTPPDVSSEEEHDMDLTRAEIVRADNSGHWWITDCVTRQHITHRLHAALLVQRGAKIAKGTGALDVASLKAMEPYVWPAAAVESIRLVGPAPGE